jgi:hypothetical protein
MLFLVCREQNTSGDEYVRVASESPEKLCTDEAEARDYCRTAPRQPTSEEGMGNTTGFTIYRIDFPANDVPELIARWDEDEQGFAHDVS